MTSEEDKAWRDEYRIGYTVRSDSVISCVPSRAELIAVFLKGENPYPKPTAVPQGEAARSEPLSESRLEYAPCTIAVVFDIERCLGSACTHDVETDVEAKCGVEPS